MAAHSRVFGYAVRDVVATIGEKKDDSSKPTMDFRSLGFKLQSHSFEKPKQAYTLGRTTAVQETFWAWVSSGEAAIARSELRSLCFTLTS